MHTKRPCAWGMFLGLLFVLGMIFAAPLRLTDAYGAAAGWMLGQESGGQRLALGAAVMLPVSAFLGALPRRLRQWKRKEKPAGAGVGECLRGLLCGFLLLLGAGLAGGGMSFHMISGTLSGALSGFASAAVVLGVAMLLAHGHPGREGA